jgi:hypothetical protein
MIERSSSITKMLGCDDAGLAAIQAIALNAAISGSILARSLLGDHDSVALWHRPGRLS